MNTETLISVIVPIYKVEKYIGKCLESVINQTYKNLEIILVDDGSPDNCGKICDGYAKIDKRIKVIHKQNGGQSEARNYGLEIAKGDYIGFVDSDDYIKEDMFEVLYNNLIIHNADISICNIINVKNEEFIAEENYEGKEIYNKTNSLQELLQNHITNYIYNKLYKKELWENIRFPVGKILEDMDVMYKIIEKANKIICTNKTEYYYLNRNDSCISKIDKKVTYDLKAVTDSRYKYLINRKELVELLNIDRMKKNLQYYYNLTYCQEKETYYNDEFTKEYSFFKNNFKKYKKDILKNQSIRKKLEINLLYHNRTLYYNYCTTRNKIKNIIRGKSK